MPRLRNQDGIEKGISRLRLKLPTSISISAPIYSHRPYKRVCSYIGFPSSFLRSVALVLPLFPLSLPSVVRVYVCARVINWFTISLQTHARDICVYVYLFWRRKRVWHVILWKILGLNYFSQEESSSGEGKTWPLTVIVIIVETIVSVIKITVWRNEEFQRICLK